MTSPTTTEALSTLTDWEWKKARAFVQIDLTDAPDNIAGASRRAAHKIVLDRTGYGPGNRATTSAVEHAIASRIEADHH